MDGKRRCAWCNPKNAVYVAYHDGEWGRLFPDDTYLYEMLVLESFQAGLSFECVLNKREAFRAAFDAFDREKVASYTPDKIEDLMRDKRIIRNRGKIEAAVKNAAIFGAVAEEYGSFGAYLRSFVGDTVLQEVGKTQSALSDAISADLRARGMCFVGSRIVYAYLQAIGLIDSHEVGCFLHKG